MLDTWALDEGIVDLEGMVGMHLSTNFYPPFPTDFITTITPLVVDAIAEVSDDNPHALIFLPTDLEPVPRAARFSPECNAFLIEADLLVDITKTWSLVE